MRPRLAAAPISSSAKARSPRRHIPPSIYCIIEHRFGALYRELLPDDPKLDDPGSDEAKLIEVPFDPKRRRLSPKQAEREARLGPLVAALYELNPRTKSDVRRVAKLAKCDVSTVYRALKRFEQNLTVSSVIGRKPDGGRGKSRLRDPEVDKIIDAAIEREYEKPEKPTFAALYKQVKADLLLSGPKPVAPNTVRLRLRWRDPQLQYARRHGHKAAAQALDPLDDYAPTGTYWARSSSLSRARICRDHRA